MKYHYTRSFPVATFTYEIKKAAQDAAQEADVGRTQCSLDMRVINLGNIRF